MYVSYELKRPPQTKIIPPPTISERSETQTEAVFFLFLKCENSGGMIVANREKKSITSSYGMYNTMHTSVCRYKISKNQTTFQNRSATLNKQKIDIPKKSPLLFNPQIFLRPQNVLQKIKQPLALLLPVFFPSFL